MLAGTPAASAGLKAGDTIVAVDGHPVRSSHDLTDRLDRLPSQAAIRLDVIRGRGPERRRLNVELRTCSRPDSGEQVSRVPGAVFRRSARIAEAGARSLGPGALPDLRLRPLWPWLPRRHPRLHRSPAPCPRPPPPPPPRAPRFLRQLRVRPASRTATRRSRLSLERTCRGRRRCRSPHPPAAPSRRRPTAPARGARADRASRRRRSPRAARAPAREAGAAIRASSGASPGQLDAGALTGLAVALLGSAHDAQVDFARRLVSERRT